jgi:serine/threonine protein kinase
MDSAVWCRLEEVIEQFEDAWRQGQSPAIDEYLRHAGTERPALLRELVHADLECRLKRGEQVRIESYLTRFPELAAERGTLLGLIDSEYQLRVRLGGDVAAAEFTQRFPAHAAELSAHFAKGSCTSAGDQLARTPATQSERDLMITFPCSHCAAKLKVQADFAGRTVLCPTCKKTLAVPVSGSTQAAVAPGAPTSASGSLIHVGIDGGVSLEPVVATREALARRKQREQRYVLEQEIARGGMGVVLRALDCDIRREVAIKYLLDRGNPTSKLRFIEEAQITGQLEHPNIVPIHELGVDAQQRLFFTMKMVKGRSLAQVLNDLRQQPQTAEKAYSLGRLLNILAGVCNALAYAHARGVIHRDLKPANIMLGDFGEVYLMDWGLAKVLKGGQASDQAAATPGVPVAAPVQPCGQVETSRGAVDDLTQAGSVVGTPAYMAPEQATGRHEALDQRSDVYALGAILYTMLTLEPPVDRDGGPLSVLMRVAEGTIAAPEQRSPARARTGKIPRELSAIAMKAMALRPQDRYPDVQALRRDIERFQEGRSVSAKQDTLRELLWKLAKRNKAVSAAVVILVPALLAALALTLVQQKEKDRAYQALVAEQREKDERTRQAVPAFVQSARYLISQAGGHVVGPSYQRALGEARQQVDVALTYDPTNADALLVKAILLIGDKDFTAGQTALAEYLKHRPDDGTARRLQGSCATMKMEDTTVLYDICQGFSFYGLRGAGQYLSEDLSRLRKAREPLLTQYRHHLEAAWPSARSRWSLFQTANGEFLLHMSGTDPTVTLEPLKGMQLNILIMDRCRHITNLGSLKGMPLTALVSVDGSNELQDLTPLQGMKLHTLGIQGWCQVKDLSVLKGMPLRMLDMVGCKTQDLEPLRGMNLEELYWTPRHVTKGVEVLRSMKSLHTLGVLGFAAPPTTSSSPSVRSFGYHPNNVAALPSGDEGFRPGEFWKRYDAGDFRK